MGFRDRLRAAIGGNSAPVPAPEAAPSLPEDSTRQRGQGTDFVALGSLDWRGHHLSGKNWSGCTLRGADLREADLSGANLANADLALARLTKANLRGADLSGANLTRAELWGADLAGADLTDADLTDATFSAVFDRGGEAYAVNVDQIASWSGARRGGKVGDDARRDVEAAIASSRTWRARENEASARRELGEDP